MRSSLENHPLYEYECESSSSPLVYTHRILVKQRSAGRLLITEQWSRLFFLIGSAAAFILPLLLLVAGLHWLSVAFFLLLFCVFQRRRNGVEQEAVVVMHGLGVQLETVYRSKRVKRRFVPLHRILWPVINEAVTPTTCFTYLALLLRDESRLTLAFLHVRPPVAMLVPIWNALCRALGRPGASKSLLRDC